MNYWLYISKLFLLIGCLLSVGCSTQQSVITENNKLENTSYNRLDYQGNRYHVHHDVIDKYDIDGKLLFTYSNKSLGEIHSIDVSNPLRVLIFYKNLQQMVITDNTLSVHNGQTIGFDALGMYQVQMVASSKMDNGMWLYDQATFQLKKLSQNFETIYQSGNLEQMIGKIQIEPKLMIENNGYLFLVCPNNGILLFDMYGAYYKTIPVLNVDYIFPADDFVYVAHKGVVEAFHLKSVESATLQLKSTLVDIFGFYNNQFYGFENGKITSSEFTVEK